jgi:hypothetical protein
MTFDRQMFSEGIGLYELTRDGRRAVLSQREAEIRRLEEHAFAKAETNRRAQYLVHDWDGRLLVVDDPEGLTIVRVCPYLESPKTSK